MVQLAPRMAGPDEVGVLAAYLCGRVATSSPAPTSGSRAARSRPPTP